MRRQTQEHFKKHTQLLTNTSGGTASQLIKAVLSADFAIQPARMATSCVWAGHHEYCTMAACDKL
eukprot:6017553-Amphidinium_carterae.1